MHARTIVVRYGNRPIRCCKESIGHERNCPRPFTASFSILKVENRQIEIIEDAIYAFPIAIVHEISLTDVPMVKAVLPQRPMAYHKG